MLWPSPIPDFRSPEPDFPGFLILIAERRYRVSVRGVERDWRDTPTVVAYFGRLPEFRKFLNALQNLRVPPFRLVGIHGALRLGTDQDCGLVVGQGFPARNPPSTGIVCPVT